MKALFIKLSALFLFVIIAAGCRKTEFSEMADSTGINSDASASAQPNVILILADDIGYEVPTYTGGQSYSTPNIDFLASHGMQFTQSHTAPLCSPSRFMLLTGKYNFRNYTTWGTLDSTQKTIANLMRKAGYATCMAGKWQFDGGGASIQKFGFQKYLVTNPFNVDFEDDGALKFYKDPQIYENGAYWPDNLTKGKYGDDIIRDYMFNFIDSMSMKKNKPFFIYWATNLVHAPFCPTPDDPEFATWNSDKKKQPGDTIYFPSMIKYEDKIVGQLLSKLKADKIAGKTLILWLGDNGTASQIHSVWNGEIVGGAKSSSTEAGTHVPMVAYLPGRIMPGTVDTSLISLVDFMATIGDVAGVSIPGSYGTTDGISFSPQFAGNYSNVRPWIFCHFLGAGKNETNPLYLKRWMQDHTYKQYDTLPNPGYSKRFYNIVSDPEEKYPIATKNMTTKEKTISKTFLNNMSQLH
ncbi:MAG: sulfatase-like hydrolase/transferase [Parafilimonas sp.]